MPSTFPGSPGAAIPNPPSFLNDDYCDWLLDVLDDLGIERAHFAGISAGAWIAMRFGSLHPHRVRKVVMLGPTGISSARLPVKIWLGRVAQKWKNADVLQDDLTARSVSSKSPGGTFGTFDRQLARAMALCTRHYRVDRSLGIYNEATGKVNLWQGLQRAAQVLPAGTRGGPAPVQGARPADLRRARGAVRSAHRRPEGAEAHG